jgi:RNA polymerase sigma-70 factor (ECF subfamily)
VPTDEALMIAYARGEQAAFDELWRRYAGLLERTMLRRLGSPEDAQDLVQQTFLQLHRARGDYDPQRPFRPWFFTIAFNLQRELFRSRARRPAGTLEVEHGASMPDANPAVADVRRALGSLPAETREVIVLHWLEGLSFGEVASLVGASEGAVKVRAHRGYVLLRRFFEGGS